MDNAPAMCYRTTEDPNMTTGSFSQEKKTFITLGLIFYIVIKVHMEQKNLHNEINSQVTTKLTIYIFRHIHSLNLIRAVPKARSGGVGNKESTVRYTCG